MVDGIKGEVVDMDFFQFNLAEMGDLVDTLTPTERYEEEELELFDHEMEAQDSDKKPTIRATLDAFAAHGIAMPVPNYLCLD